VREREGEREITEQNSFKYEYLSWKYYEVSVKIIRLLVVHTFFVCIIPMWS